MPITPEETYAVMLQTIDSYLAGETRLLDDQDQENLGLGKRQTIRIRRMLGTGPEFVRIGKRALSSREQLARWLADRAASSTAEEAFRKENA